ncbi:uncharacterized protein LOC117322353 [Pecten maximus]|uniref:uncharacterized protein LOC117322353 n=1 Tax=Pecten maximus TaxID=6579 RepID=UPI001458A81B|nr:uncharacterized protein LOC117322353 [Pecten maximus]
MKFRILMSIILLVSGVKSTYKYIGTPSSLRNAYSSCHSRNGRLVTYGDDLKSVIQNWNSPVNISIWTGTFRLLSSWIKFVGCHKYYPHPDPNRSLVFLANTSAAACAIHCNRYNNKYFALQGKRCACVGSSDVILRTPNAGCNFTCDGSHLSEPCGSITLNNWSLYTRVTFGQDTTAFSDHCIAGLCNGEHGMTLHGSNCTASFHGVCSNGDQLRNTSDWSSSLKSCVSTYGSYLVTNVAGICWSMHHYGWKKFWTGQFRGVAQHQGSDLPNVHIVGCSLLHIETTTHNETTPLRNSVGCETELRPYICKLNDYETDTISTVDTTGTTLFNRISISTQLSLINSTEETVNSSRTPIKSAVNKDSPISEGAVVAIVIGPVLTACALVGILYLRRRKIWCFQTLSIGQAVCNQSYDSSFINKPDHQEDHHSYDEIEHKSDQTDDAEGENATTDDIYAHPTFDYKVEDIDGEDSKRSYLDMGGSLAKQRDTITETDEEYVYMGDDVSNKCEDNEDKDMYSFMTPRHSVS